MTDFETPQQRDLRLSQEIEQEQCIRSEPITRIVRLYVCPNCGNYFGSSSTKDLSTQEIRDLKGNPIGTRLRCPGCGTDRQERFARLIDPAEVDQARRTAEKAVTNGR